MTDDAEIPLRLRIVRGPDDQQTGADAVDASIPMLTEVMDFQRVSLDDPEKLALPLISPEQGNSLDWNALKQSLQHNILESLLEKSDAFLAREFQERVKPLLERTVASMVQDLHIHLEQVLRDAVASAITDELNKLQMPRDASLAASPAASSSASATEPAPPSPSTAAPASPSAASLPASSAADLPPPHSHPQVPRP